MMNHGRLRPVQYFVAELRILAMVRSGVAPQVLRGCVGFHFIQPNLRSLPCASIMRKPIESDFSSVAREGYEIEANNTKCGAGSIYYGAV